MPKTVTSENKKDQNIDGQQMTYTTINFFFLANHILSDHYPNYELMNKIKTKNKKDDKIKFYFVLGIVKPRT